MDSVKEVLNTWKISWDGLVSYILDGASVMSGHKIVKHLFTFFRWIASTD